jgi:LemA protein
MAEANAAMQAPLGRLLAISEAYPELRSSANFTQLMDQLEGPRTGSRSRGTDYNAAVEQFNATIRRFPTNLTAKMFGLGTAREYYEADAAAAEAPKVKF